MHRLQTVFALRDAAQFIASQPRSGNADQMREVVRWAEDAFMGRILMSGKAEKQFTAEDIQTGLNKLEMKLSIHAQAAASASGRGGSAGGGAGGGGLST